MSSSKEAVRLAQFSRAVRESSLKRLRLVTEGFENWRPTPEAMSFAEHALHLIDCDNYLFDQLEGKSPKPCYGLSANYEVEDRGQFLSLLDNLARIGQQRAGIIEKMTDDDLERTLFDARFEGDITVWWLIVRGNLDHEIHHRGQLVTGLRLAGLV